MIRLLPRGATPGTLSSQKVTEAKQEAATKINNGQKAAFPSYWLEDDVRGLLFESQHGKCAYCERRREMKRESDVEHFRPKGEVFGEQHPGYWWLAYAWENYFYACKPCNQGYKKTQFPLLPGGVRATSPTDDLAAEKPVLIDPITEDPEVFLCYVWQHSGGRLVKAVGVDDEGRGTQTTHILGLNRMSLMEEERPELLKSLLIVAKAMLVAIGCKNELAMEELKGVIAYETDRERPLLAFRRYIFREMQLEPYVSNN